MRPMFMPRKHKVEQAVLLTDMHSPTQVQYREKVTGKGTVVNKDLSTKQVKAIDLAHHSYQPGSATLGFSGRHIY